jgi:thiamine biosynthesis lipoprotein ApbE
MKFLKFIVAIIALFAAAASAKNMKKESNNTNCGGKPCANNSLCCKKDDTKDKKCEAKAAKVTKEMKCATGYTRVSFDA